MNIYTEQDLREVLTSLAEPDATPVDVWTPLQARVARRRVRMVVAVAGVSAAVVTLAVLMWPGGGSPDSIGIAHDGRTVVTFTADRPLTSGELSTSVDILRQRVDALGMAGAGINTLDGSVTLSVPATDVSVASLLGARGEFQLRQVLMEKSGGGSSGGATAGDLAAAETLFQQQDCAGSSTQTNESSTAAVPTASYLVACNANGGTAYLLAPAFVANADVASANATEDTTMTQWFVDVQFTNQGSTAWQQVTARAAQQPGAPQCQPPGGCNGIGIVVDGQILSVPTVDSGPGGIAGGQMQIGAESRDEARVLAAEIAAPPLPAPLTATTSAGPAGLPSPCGNSFALSLVSDRNGQATPEAAGRWFVVHGGVGHLPKSGWTVTEQSDGAATLQSGRSTLHVIQGSDRTWQVDSGHECG